MLFLVTVPLSAQDSGASSDPETPWAPLDNRALLAMTTTDYPVTPGDIYTLTWVQSARTVTQDVVIEHDGTINLGLFGTIESRGTTFPELRRRIEETVGRAYRDSYPRVIIRSLGQFQLLVTGEVTRAGLVTADGLTRLSTVYESRATEFASERRVTVTGTTGARRDMDLFRARRQGELAQDPYLRPGDRIQFHRATRTVTLGGRVYRSGSYQLLTGETMADLLDRYGEGTLEDADLSEVRLDRVTDDPEETTRTVYLNLRETPPRQVQLHHRDRVTIPSRDRFRPVAFFEIHSAVDGEPRQTRHEIRFTRGEKLSEVVRRGGIAFPADTDLFGAYLIREGEEGTRNINLSTHLFDPAPRDDLELVPGDRIVVPAATGAFRVNLRGEVNRTGQITLQGRQRVSQVVSSHATEFASTREVTVRHAAGATTVVDLFLAQRDGDQEQDPFLRQDDTLILTRATRTVTLGGRVYRSGSYQLLTGETMADLLERYGEGTLEDADLSEVRLDRVTDDPEETTRTVYLNLRETPPRQVQLHHRDRVTIPSRDRFRPVVFFEMISSGADGDERVRQEVRFTPGEKLSEVVRRSGEIFSSGSDLSSAYLVRRGMGGVTSVDLSRFRWDPNPPDDLEIQPGDRIVVPSTARFVVVSGAVRTPGTVPFIPDRTYEYYLQSRGGVDPNLRWGTRPVIRDTDNRRRAPSEPIQPGDRIHLRTNSPFFYLLPAVSVVSSTISLILLLERR